MSCSLIQTLKSDIGNEPFYKPNKEILVLNFNVCDLEDYVEGWNEEQIHLALECSLNVIFHPRITLLEPIDDFADIEEQLICETVSLMQNHCDGSFYDFHEIPKTETGYVEQAIYIENQLTNFINKLAEDISCDSYNENVNYLYEEMSMANKLNLVNFRYYTTTTQLTVAVQCLLF
ncbi:hypothetical protein [Aeromonas phage ZPAH34]|uniref:hypothetical protein n=1 Tax=Aeromonas phage ZPAH34 TaxID=2924888 RepID=UPI0023292FD1|nr:hypothetical protein PQD16_gp057 [Aeromonas phage ZPAH34]UOX39626.1 hypothetical protein [Aeromonas phage ZPAH34]